MNYKELEASRKVLMVSRRELAENILRISERYYSYMEVGERAITDSVANKIENLIEMRRDFINKLSSDDVGFLDMRNLDELPIMERTAYVSACYFVHVDCGKEIII